MIYEKDYIYDYSDIRLLKTRAQVLTGKYEGLIVEFGGSLLGHCEESNEFSYEWTLLQKPLYTKIYKNDKDFTDFLTQLMIDIIEHRKNDVHAKDKLDEALAYMNKSKIKINEEEYKRELT